MISSQGELENASPLRSRTQTIYQSRPFHGAGPREHPQSEQEIQYTVSCPSLTHTFTLSLSFVYFSLYLLCTQPVLFLFLSSSLISLCLPLFLTKYPPFFSFFLVFQCFAISTLFIDLLPPLLSVPLEYTSRSFITVVFPYRTLYFPISLHHLLLFLHFSINPSISKSL